MERLYAVSSTLCDGIICPGDGGGRETGAGRGETLWPGERGQRDGSLIICLLLLHASMRPCCLSLSSGLCRLVCWSSVKVLT